MRPPGLYLHRGRLQRLMVRAGLPTQRALAHHLGIAPSGLNRYILGKQRPGGVFVEKLCALFGCQPSAFLRYGTPTAAPPAAGPAPPAPSSASAVSPPH